MNEAKRLLQDTDDSILQIANAVGYEMVVNLQVRLKTPLV